VRPGPLPQARILADDRPAADPPRSVPRRPPPGAPPLPPPQQPRKRRLIAALVGVGALLLIGGGILLGVALRSGKDGKDDAQVVQEGPARDSPPGKDTPRTDQGSASSATPGERDRPARPPVVP